MINKLNKTKLNELLYYINSDNYKYCLILKLIYVYARNAREVLNLKPEDIDLTHETIKFTTQNGDVTFPLVEDIHDDLMGYIYDRGIEEDELIFREYNERTHKIEPVKITIRKINYYLEKTIESLNNTIDFNAPKLSTKDFKILRGQHLYIDGTSLQTIHELYCNAYLMSTRDILDFNELKKYVFSCDSIDKVFNDNTDLNIYYDYRFELTDLYTVSDDKENLIIEIDHDENIINIITNDEDSANITKRIQEIEPEVLFYELRRLKSSGNFKFINDLKFVKN